MVVMVEPGVTKQQLEQITNDLVKRTNAENVGYTDFPELLMAGHSLGDWNAYTGSRLRDKDWSKRPQQEDVDMWSEFMQAEVALVNEPSPSDDIEDKFQRMAERHGIDAEEVKRRVDKVTSWIAT